MSPQAGGNAGGQFADSPVTSVEDGGRGKEVCIAAAASCKEAGEITRRAMKRSAGHAAATITHAEQ